MYEYRKQLLDYDEYDVETKSCDNSCFFMNWNQPSKFNEDAKNDGKLEDLDAKLLVYDVQRRKPN